MMNDLNPKLYVGIDWGSKAHAICLYDTQANIYEQQTLEHKTDLLTNWGLELKERYPTHNICACLEQGRGPLISALNAMPGITCYPINPKSLARYREARFPSRSKSDPADARLICDFLRHHIEDLRAYAPLDAASEKLARLTEHRRRLVDERTRQVNRLRAALKEYFPNVLEWFDELNTTVVWQFLLKWPTLSDAQGAKQKDVLNFLYASNVRRGKLLKSLHVQVKSATPLHDNEAVIEAMALLVQTLCNQLLALQAGIRRYDKRIEAEAEKHPEHWLVENLPGAGPQLRPRLLAAFGTERSRFPDALVLAQLAGIAPVRESSGNTEWVHMRWAASKFLRQTFHEFALHSIAKSEWARNYYEHAKKHGKKHHAAIRALAFKWIRILYACWRDAKPYSEAEYMERLKCTRSPYAKAA